MRPSWIRNRNKIKKELSSKFNEVLEILRTKHNDKEVRELLNTKLQDELTETTFSKMKNAFQRSDYLKDVHEKNFSKIFEILEPLIQKDFRLAWDNQTKKFKQSDSGINNPRLQGLLGVWEGYSWDDTTSKNTKKEYIHLFKVNIISPSNIICVTQRATLLSNSIVLIENRFVIELANHHRKIILISNIGVADEEGLRKTSTFYAAYVDTGDSKVKAGLAVLKRSDKSFEDIIVESKEISYIDEPHLIEFLRNTQLIIK